MVIGKAEQHKLRYQKVVISKLPMAEMTREMRYRARYGASGSRDGSPGPVSGLEKEIHEGLSKDKHDQKLAQRPESGARTG